MNTRPLTTTIAAGLSFIVATSSLAQVAPEKSKPADAAPKAPATAPTPTASKPAPKPAMVGGMPRPEKPKTPPTIDDALLKSAVEKGITLLLKMQEGDGRGEWPYEGVYKVREKNAMVIPIGYRIGNTGITAGALILAPGYDKDQARQAAIARACTFVCKGIEHPLMSVKDYDGNYDVRGWGYSFGLDFLMLLKKKDIIPTGQEEAVKTATAFYLDAIQETAIPKNGGWNYARPAGRDTPAAPSSFMTSCVLQTLFEARAQGLPVKDEVVEGAIKFLASSRAKKNGTDVGGPVMYSGSAKATIRDADDVPGAVGRMCAAEVTLNLAGKSSVEHLRAAVEAFVKYWDELDKRRMMGQTHLPPYMVAPYYFMYAHRYAALAVEMLPEAERPKYRKQINELLFGVRSEDGSWNDRVFPRTANFGTSFAMMAIMQPTLEMPAKWVPKKYDRAKNAAPAEGEKGK